ncbi:MAG: sensor domain-containing diguanylate cyclase [bacterium]
MLRYRQILQVWRIASHRASSLFLIFNIIFLFVVLFTGQEWLWRILVVFLIALLPVFIVMDIKNIKSETRYMRLYHSLCISNEIINKIASTIQIEELLNLILSGIKKIFTDTSRVILFLRDDEKSNVLRAKAGFDISEDELNDMEFLIDKSLGTVPRAVITGEVQFVQDSATDYYCKQEFVEKFGLKAFVVVPIIVHGNGLGAILVEHKSIKSTKDKEENLLKLFGNHAGIAIENAMLYKKVEELSVTDEMTGLFNYRYFRRIWNPEFERAKRYGREVSLVMIDVDHFKEYNDTYGHPAGDLALKDIGRIFHDNTRKPGTVARYGGEEFIAILIETGKKGALIAGERIRSAVETHKFKDKENELVRKLTVSIGVATYPEDAETEEKLIEQVDNALYKSKAAGRNRVSTP